MKFIKKIFQNYFFKPDFRKFWKKNRGNKNIPKSLKIMTDNFIDSTNYNLISNYWKQICINNYNDIIFNKGIKNYGQNLAFYYFTFSEYGHEEIKTALKKISKNKISFNGDLLKQHNCFNFNGSLSYNYLIIILYIYIKKQNLLFKLKKIKDIGFIGFNDPFITCDNIKLTSDKLISLLDYQSIFQSINKNKINSIIEIGAGSGRVSDVILSLNKNIKYIICDIIPTLFISYTRLKKVYKNKKIKIITNLNSADQINKAIIENDILFIFPEQLKLINSKSIDLIFAIDCIHEMDKKTIKKYFNEITRLGSYFYFSVWVKTVLPYTGLSRKLFSQRYDYFKKDYPIPKSWKLINEKNNIFPANHINSSYKIK